MKIEIRLENAEDADEIEVAEIFVSPGDRVEEGAPILEVATDKANQEVWSPVAGTVVEILVGQGDIVAAGVVLAVVEADA